MSSALNREEMMTALNAMLREVSAVIISSR